MGLFSRLNELTAIKNDFEDEITTGGPGGTPHRFSRDGRREQLGADLQRVSDARRDEILRLNAAGTPLADVASELDRTDRNRNR